TFTRPSNSLLMPFMLLVSQTLLLHYSHNSPTEIYTLSLHDALPIFISEAPMVKKRPRRPNFPYEFKIALVEQSLQPGTCVAQIRSEEHTSELQSRFDLVCRLLLEKKNKQKNVHDNLTPH